MDPRNLLKRPPCDWEAMVDRRGRTDQEWNTAADSLEFIALTSSTGINPRRFLSNKMQALSQSRLVHASTYYALPRLSSGRSDKHSTRCHRVSLGLIKIKQSYIVNNSWLSNH